MTAPADTAFSALAAALGARLAAAGFLAAPQSLVVNPAAAFEDAADGPVFAALYLEDVAVVQTFLGRAQPRYEVRLSCALTAGALGPGADSQLARAQDVLAALLLEDETLGGAALQLEAREAAAFDVLEPEGRRWTQGLAITISAADPLGRVAGLGAA